MPGLHAFCAAAACTQWRAITATTSEITAHTHMPPGQDQPPCDLESTDGAGRHLQQHPLATNPRAAVMHWQPGRRERMEAHDTSVLYSGSRMRYHKSSIPRRPISCRAALSPQM